VREQLTVLDEPWNRRWMKPIDLTVCDEILTEIGLNPEAQSRERLHLAIYGGKLPHYYHGEIQRSSPEAEDTRRHSWRHPINTLYSFDLAQKYSSAPVLNSKWFTLPDCLPRDEMPAITKLERVGRVKATQIHFDHLTVPFVAAVRAEDDFWASLNRLETASVSGDSSGYASAFEEHLRLVSWRFREHLYSTGWRDLVEESAVELWAQMLPRGSALSALILAGVGQWYGLPWQTVGSAFLGTVGSVGVFTLIARGLLAGVKVRSPKFKAFEVNLRKMVE
jgi:hypothetical protein